MMARPLIKVELSLTPPTLTAEWIDITEFFISCRITRGVQHELGRVEAGKLEQLRLDNIDRRFDPEYAGSIVNLVTNPSFEVDLTGWSAWIGTGSFSRVSESTAPSGGFVFQQTFDGSSFVYGQSFTVTGLIPGETYTISAYVRRVSGSGRLELDVEESGIIDTNGLSSYDPAPGGPWVRVSETFVYPLTGSGTVNIRPHSANTPTGIAQWDAIQLEQGELTDYIDGDQDNARWAGAEHDSQTYRGGPYYPDLKIMRRVRVSGIFDDVTYAQITAYLEDTEDEFPVPTDSEAVWDAVDGFLILNLKKVSGSFLQARSDIRIDELLSAAGWTTGSSWILGIVGSQLGVNTTVGPVGDRSLDQGLTTVQAKTYANEPVLSAIKEVVDTENGNFFMSKEGYARFLNRHYSLFQSVSQAVFGDDIDGGELPYLMPAIGRDETRIWNNITTTRAGGTPQVASDASSIADYYQRDTEFETLHLTDAEALSSSRWNLYRYKEPGTRVLNILLDPEGLDEIIESQVWHQMLQREIGDTITIKWTHPGGGPRLNQPSIIEGIHHDISVYEGWKTVFHLSPYLLGNFWVLGDTGNPNQSILGISTVVGY
jgi:hypothetical protein